jgi:hypothetical protein
VTLSIVAEIRVVAALAVDECVISAVAACVACVAPRVADGLSVLLGTVACVACVA